MSGNRIQRKRRWIQAHRGSKDMGGGFRDMQGGFSSRGRFRYIQINSAVEGVDSAAGKGVVNIILSYTFM
jgi:hypothetical protein